MLTEVIGAKSIDEAVKRILEELKEEEDAGTARSTRSRRNNFIYFDGWDGLGASAVLREVGRCLTPAASQEEEPAAPAGSRRAPAAAAAAGLEFSRIFHIDCSKWESRRAMQRAVAEQLELAAPVMEMFDAQDVADDYQGVSRGSRAEMPQVAEEIYQHIEKLGGRFLVIFHNGSSEEIDLDSLGLPLSGWYSRNKALWSFQGRFRLYPRAKVDRALEHTRATTDLLLSAACSNIELSDILRHEAEELAREMLSVGGIDWPAAAGNCFTYMIKLCGMGSRLVDYDLATHGCNYWACDGIIQLHQQGDDDAAAADRLWVSAEALKREMRLDADYHQKTPHLPSPVVRRLYERTPCWASPAYGSMLIQLDESGHIPKGMFQGFGKLCVLKLSACAFSFASPPFLCCHSLRFLGLDHCRQGSGEGDVGKEEDLRRFFQRLWVLDVRDSSAKELLSEEVMDHMTQLRELNVVRAVDYADMDPLMRGGRLHNIRKLRVTKSRTGCSGLEYLFSGKDKMELLDFSGNTGYKKRLFVPSTCSSLETVIIDGSIRLEKISLKGCAKLKNLLLSGSFPDLGSLDLTGTAAETLDISAVAAPKLDELFLLDCGKLCAILWPPAAEDRRKRYLGKLRIDTTQEEGAAAAAAAAGRSPTESDWYISVRDARFLGSLEPVKDYFGANSLHVEISTTTASPTSPRADAAAGSKGVGIKSGSGQQVQANLQQLKDNAIHADVAAAFKKDTTSMQQQANGGDCDAPAIMCICPPPPHLAPSQGCCFMRIEDQMRTNLQRNTSSITVPGFICDSAKILHAHDSMFMTGILASPLGSAWNQLEWCRVERCPELECVFGSPLISGQRGSDGLANICEKLRTLWASQLLNARHISKWIGGPLVSEAFAGLTLLHIDRCPRLIRAFSFSSMKAFQSLETLEIMWCGDLRVVFSGILTFPFLTKKVFPRRLKHIHLHELPSLQNIYSQPIKAPNLETIKIRGCWKLMSLPTVDGTVECDCEKEWWDRIKWSPRKQADQYKPTHSRYYKKTMLRGSALR